MKIYPAIDIRHGKVVQLVGGDPDKVAVTEERKPAEQARHWRRMGASMVHVVDLDAALGQERQWQHIGAIRNEGVKLQFGGGVRSMLDVQKLFDLGASNVIIGTQGVKEPRWLQEVAALFPGRILLAIDARGRDIQIKGWTESAGKDVVDVARQVADFGLAGLLYTNVAKEGRLEGIDAEIVRDIREAAPQMPLIVSGGISNIDDLATLDGLGVAGVVLGMSIYTGAIDLQDAVERFEAKA